MLYPLSRISAGTDIEMILKYIKMPKHVFYYLTTIEKLSLAAYHLDMFFNFLKCKLFNFLV